MLQHTSNGLNTCDIANAMGIAVKTVEAHISHILQKTGAKDRNEALSIVLRRGWMEGNSAKTP